MAWFPGYYLWVGPHWLLEATALLGLAHGTASDDWDMISVPGTMSLTLVGREVRKTEVFWDPVTLRTEEARWADLTNCHSNSMTLSQAEAWEVCSSYLSISDRSCLPWLSTLSLHSPDRQTHGFIRSPWRERGWQLRTSLRDWISKEHPARLDVYGSRSRWPIQRALLE
jgi:hypothetical protein